MSTTMIWFVFFIVVLLVVLFSALYKKKFSALDLAVIGMMAALSFVAYTFLRIPNVFGTGASFHLGNTFTALTAMLLDGVSGGLAGAIGLSLADIIAGEPHYAITTFLLKFIIGITCGLFARHVFKLREHSRAEGFSYLLRVTGTAFSGLLLNVVTDPLLGYFRKTLIQGLDTDIASVLTKITGGVTFVNSVLSCICAVAFFFALEPVMRNLTARFTKKSV